MHSCRYFAAWHVVISSLLYIGLGLTVLTQAISGPPLPERCDPPAMAPSPGPLAARIAAERDSTFLPSRVWLLSPFAALPGECRGARLIEWD